MQVGIKMFRATIVGSNRLQTATGFPKLSPDRILTMNNLKVSGLGSVF